MFTTNLPFYIFFYFFMEEKPGNGSPDETTTTFRIKRIFERNIEVEIMKRQLLHKKSEAIKN